MSTKASNLLQKAGQALHNASQALTAAGQEYGGSVNKAMAAAPFSVSTDQLFDTWKACARMAQEVAALDSRLRDVFAQVQSLQETSTVSAMPLLSSNTATAPVAAETATATDVTAKVSPAAKASKKVKTAATKATAKQKAVKEKVVKEAVAAKAKKPKAAKAAKVVTDGASKLPGNAEKVLNHLKTVLNDSEFVHINQSAIAQGSGLPQGSIAASLNRLMAVNLLTEGDKGHFKLVAA